MPNCPRDGAMLTAEKYHGIEVDRCSQCSGRWFDYEELDQLEATIAPNEADRRATIEYSKRPSELNCPVCGKTMRAFNYRAHSLELDVCEEKHGFWLDPGEENNLREIMEERLRGLERSVAAEQSWGDFVQRGGKRSLWDNIKGMFGGGRR